ncbi:MAG: PKD domain-containing protein [FCB group bacterium]|nr:PKD domain-containing protein [FCB group bacterium]
MRARPILCLIFVLCIVMFYPVTAAEQSAALLETNASTDQISPEKPDQPLSTVGNYNATLRVYVIEKLTYRWWDNLSNWYRNAMLSFAIDSAISIPLEGTASITATWNGNDHTYTNDDGTGSYTFGNIVESNIMVVAALFNADPITSYSDDPPGSPFNAYLIDASAAADMGETGSDNTSGGYTHTVLLEKATRVGCSNCPTTAAVLNYLEELGTYNFHYVSMVYQPNPAARSQVYSYNLAAVPTCYIDGGHGVAIGGSYESDYYTDPMDAAGHREVADVDLEVSLTWLGNATIQVDVEIANHQFYNSAPDIPATPAGPATGVSGSSYEFTASTTDLDGHQIYYRWDWGDGEISDWVGPYASGATGAASHAFPAGDFDVKVQAKDDYGDGDESDWSTVSSISLLQRGEVNGDGNINVGDAVYLINYVFKSGETPEPLDRGDANCDLSVNVGDAVWVINYVFKSGSAPGCY